jgi:hypothetical protein
MKPHAIHIEAFAYRGLFAQAGNSSRIFSNIAIVCKQAASQFRHWAKGVVNASSTMLIDQAKVDVWSLAVAFRPR